MTVLLVDDQRHVLDALLAGVPWKEMPMVTQVLTAGGAEEAIDVLARENVSLLITDIEMPGLNGVDLAVWTRERYPELLLIFLTAHADFRYAQHAVKLGVFDYVLQPVDYGKLKEVVLRALLCISKNRQAQRQYALGGLWKQQRSQIIRSIVVEYITGSTPLDAALERLLEADCRPSKSAAYRVLLGGIISDHARLSEWRKERATELLLEQLQGRANEAALFMGLDHTHVLGVYREDASAFKSSLYLLPELMEKQHGIRVALYLSQSAPLAEMPAQYAVLRQDEKKNVAYYAGFFPHEERAYPAAENAPESIPFRDLMAKRRLDDVVQTVREYLEHGKLSHTVNSEQLAVIHQDFVQAALSALEIVGVSASDLFRSPEFLEQYSSSLSDIYCFMAFVEHTCDFLKRNLTAHPNENLVSMAKQYLEEHQDAPFNRKALADHLLVSEDYLSHLFKRETGMSPSDYLTSYRLEQSKLLLRNTRMPISMIALKVGFSDFSYFAKVFKRDSGMTPNEYRKQP